MGAKRVAEEQLPSTFDPAWPLAGGYYRKSQVFGEEDRVSTQRQRDAIMREGERAGHNIEWWCDEEGHRSGRHDHTRPGYMAFKRRLISGAYRTVIFYRLDRANRSIKETIWLVEHCQKAGVRLIIIRDGFDSARDGWQARAIRRLYHDAVDNQGEADDAADRMRDAIRHAKSKGIPWGTTPKGYLRIGVGSNAKWVKRAHSEPHAPHEKRQQDNSAGDVRTWLTIFATHSYQATADEANRRGMKWYDRDGRPTLWVAVLPCVVRCIHIEIYFYKSVVLHSFYNKENLTRQGKFPSRWPLSFRPMEAASVFLSSRFPVSLVDFRKENALCPCCHTKRRNAQGTPARGARRNYQSQMAEIQSRMRDTGAMLTATQGGIVVLERLLSEVQPEQPALQPVG